MKIFLNLFKIFTIPAVGFCLVSHLVGCASAPLEKQQARTAPRSQEQTGALVFGAGPDDIQAQFEGRDFRWRELSSRHQLYEVYGLSREEIAAALPQAIVEVNEMVKTRVGTPGVISAHESDPDHGSAGARSLGPGVGIFKKEISSFSNDRGQLTENHFNLDTFSGVSASGSSQKDIPLPTSF